MDSMENNYTLSDFASGELLSNCCWGPFEEDMQICLECGEHAEGVDSSEEE